MKTDDAYQSALLDLEQEFREIANRALAGAVLAHMLATNRVPKQEVRT